MSVGLLTPNYRCIRCGYKWFSKAVFTLKCSNCGLTRDVNKANKVEQ